MQEKLSPNLSLKEVIKSATAIKHGIDNSPSQEHYENLKAIANEVFQKVRIHFGVPIAVTSGYRSPELNKRIGGSSKSQHCHGEALDLDADVYGKITNKQIFDYIDKNLDYDQMIWEFGDDNEPNWVHVSYKKDGGNRNRNLRAKKVNGKTTYEVM